MIKSLRIYLLLGFLTSTTSFGQVIDSLQREIDKYLDYDTTKISLMLRLSEHIEDKELELEIIQDAYGQSKIGQHPKHVALSINYLAYFYFYDGEYEKAEELWTEAVEICRSNNFTKELAENLLDLGQVQDIMQKDDLSLKNTLEALEILENTSEYALLANGYINMGGFYYYRGKTSEALEHYLKAKEFFVKPEMEKEYYTRAVLEANIAWCYYYQDDLEKAAEQLNLSVQIHNNNEYYSPSSGTTRSSLASLYVEMGDYDLARVHALDGLDICLEIDYPSGIGSAYEILGEIEFADEHYEKSAEAYLKGLAYADSLNELYEQSKRSEYLSKAYSKMENYEMAYNFISQAKIYNDSLKEIEAEAAFEDAITKYETEKKEAENALLQEQAKLKDLQLDKERQEAQAEQERQWIIGGSIGVLLISGLFFLINRNRLKTRTNKQLEHQRDEIAGQKKEITDSITYAKNIQKSFLPREGDFETHFEESFLMYEPKDIVAGDFYILEEADDYIYFSVADCTGHGVPGAMVSIVCANAIRKVIHELNERDPGKILDKTRDIVISQFERKGHTVNDGMDISFCRLDKKNMKLAWAGANNPLMIVRAENNALIEIKPNKQPIGGYVTTAPFTSHEVDLEKGDVIFMSSDGYPDQFGGEKGKKFKYKRFKELLHQNAQEPLRKQKELLSREFWDWKQGYEQIDDVCVMGVKI